MPPVRITAVFSLLLLLAVAACQDDPAAPTGAEDKAALLQADGGEDPPPVFVTGLVRDDMGRAVGGIDVVALPHLQRTTTGADGTYGLGPFAAGEEIRLQTESPDAVSTAGARDAWFDYVTDPFDPTVTDEQNILLLVRYDDVDFDFGADTFVRYLQSAWNLSFNYDQIFPWGGPVRIYSRPDTFTAVDDDGHAHASDLRTMVSECVRTWNEALGFTALVETSDADGAEIVASFRDIGGGAYGRTLLTPQSAFWRAPPEGAEVVLNTYYPRQFWAEHQVGLMSTLMHEIGHALGHRGHLFVHLRDAQGRRIDDILMYITPPRGTYQPHPFDLRVMRALKKMPSGTHFRQYEAFFNQGDFPPLGSGRRPERLGSL